MSRPSVCVMTICGGGEEYDFLFGQMLHHARMGMRHVVLDTTRPEERVNFYGLPSSVLWVNDPSYGYGWKDFNSRLALTRANQIAQWTGADVIAYVDCDEWLDEKVWDLAIPTAVDMMVSLEMHHWRTNGKLHRFGRGERHRKLWPGSMDVVFPQNHDWIHHNPLYNGNPNRHIAPEPAVNGDRYETLMFVDAPILQHVHYALGQKSKDEETARSTIGGWPHGVSVAPVEWPAEMARWRDEGVHPSKAFR